ncbi:hypothetical protein F5876DRAFT_66484 [Lentinula aff. lateritia]|uniref:Uncharacterized protein n=1 Tax=Lentinula aff. lateritia TaxID=2804960 RepID=A0ACC1TXA1_9AGAR|nr:hypothetical protein F5876DRAFT_66484 [Lentinula aff. lateritia]
MSKTQAQAVLLSIACAILAAFDTLDNVEDADLPLDDPCEDLEVLKVVAAIMIHEALEIKGDGTRGPYNQFPKSRDWFPTSLQQPDRWFRNVLDVASKLGLGLGTVVRPSMLGAGWSSKGATGTTTEDGNDLVVAGIASGSGYRVCKLLRRDTPGREGPGNWGLEVDVPECWRL